MVAVQYQHQEVSPLEIHCQLRAQFQEAEPDFVILAEHFPLRRFLAQANISGQFLQEQAFQEMQQVILLC